MPQSKRSSPKTNTYAFIDTNIFLDFYRSRTEATLSLLEKLDSVKDRVICTYQVEMEFLKNRQSEISKISQLQDLNIDVQLPAVLGDSQIDGAVKKIKKETAVRSKQLDQRVLNLLKNPSTYDPIYKSLEELFSSPSEHVLTRDMPVRHKVKRLAWRRFILGYPPRKRGDTSIGDGLNWEWFVHCANQLKGRFVIVSRDSDYGVTHGKESFLNDALKSEFRDRVGKKSIRLTTKLSDALKSMDIPVTKEEEKSESEDLELSEREISSDSARSLSESISVLGNLKPAPDLSAAIRALDASSVHHTLPKLDGLSNKLNLSSDFANAIKKIEENSKNLQRLVDSLSVSKLGKKDENE